VDRDRQKNVAVTLTWRSVSVQIHFELGGWLTRWEVRGRENRGRKALHETLKEMAERTHLTEEEREAKECLLVEQARGARPGKPGKLLHSVHLRGGAMRPGKRTQRRTGLS